MGFENIIESFFSNQKQSKEQRKHLTQGNTLLNIRESLLNNIISAGREGFDTSKLKKMDTREKKIIGNLENKYNRLVKDYADSYKLFLQDHAELESQVLQCKTECYNTYSLDKQDGADKRGACQAGCVVKGPYITKCADSYKGWKGNPSRVCAHMTENRCSGGEINLGKAQNEVINAKYEDKPGTNLKDGCCVCGGGDLGGPTTRVSGEKITWDQTKGECKGISRAFGTGQNNSGLDKTLKSICKQAGNNIETGKTSKFHVRYEAIKGKNKKISDVAEALYSKIDDLSKIDNSLKTHIADEENLLKTNLTSFEEKYAKVMEMGGEEGKDPTIEAQRKATVLKRQAEEMSFYIMSILAIVLVVTTIINFKRQI